MTASQVSPESEVDFFVSYNGRDEKWAEWIAWQLESTGRKVIIQAWDFRPGSNFVIEMDRAAKQAKRTLLVLSPNFFQSQFTPPEWAQSFAGDPSGTLRSVVPVVVEPCDVDGLLGTIVHIDLTGLTREAAAKKLLAGIEPGRSKPTSEPDFPGGDDKRPITPAPVATVRPKWQLEASSVVPIWKKDIETKYGRSTGASVVEVHVLLTSPQLLEMRQLQTLVDGLSVAGRQGGLFTAAQEVEGDSSEALVYARSGNQRFADDVGLIVTRQGQRGGWLALPHDTMGSVLDAEELTSRLTSLLGLLLGLDLPSTERVVVTAAVAPLMMLTVGDSSVIGSRNSASLRTGSADRLELATNESVLYSEAQSNPSDVAAELVARLIAAVGSRR